MTVTGMVVLVAGTLCFAWWSEEDAEEEPASRLCPQDALSLRPPVPCSGRSASSVAVQVACCCCLSRPAPRGRLDGTHITSPETCTTSLWSPWRRRAAGQQGWVEATGGALSHHHAFAQQTFMGFLLWTRHCLCPGVLEADQHSWKSLKSLDRGRL